MDKPKPLPCPHCDAALNEFPDHWQHPKNNNCLASGWVLRPHRIPLWNRRAPWTVTRVEAREGVRLWMQTPGGRDAGLEAMVAYFGGKVEG